MGYRRKKKKLSKRTDFPESYRKSSVNFRNWKIGQMHLKKEKRNEWDKNQLIKNGVRLCFLWYGN